MDRLFDAAFPVLNSLQREDGYGSVAGEFPVDFYQDKDAFVVRAELPGFRKEDLDLEVTDGVLTITAQRKPERKTSEKEEAPGTAIAEPSVSRSLPLPDDVQADAIQAKYENGVLSVTLPKREEAKPLRITVNVK
jgi:HSP20 family protein